MVFRYFSSIDRVEFTDETGRHFRIVQTGRQEGRAVVRFELCSCDAMGNAHWQEVATHLHVSLYLCSAGKPGSAGRLQLGSQHAGMHSMRAPISLPLARLLRRAAQYSPRGAQDRRLLELPIRS